jgi:ribosomal protein L7/L12
MESMRCPSCGSPSIKKIGAGEYECQSCNTKAKLSNDQTFLVFASGNLCPECGFSNESDSKFCGKCGAKITKFCASCGAEIQAGMSFCPKCGHDQFTKENTVSVTLKPTAHFEKIDAIKMLRDLSPSPLGLIEAKTLIEKESVIAVNILQEEGVILKGIFEGCGMQVELNRSVLLLDPLLRTNISSSKPRRATKGGCLPAATAAFLLIAAIGILVL